MTGSLRRVLYSVLVLMLLSSCDGEGTAVKATPTEDGKATACPGRQEATAILNSKSDTVEINNAISALNYVASKCVDAKFTKTEKNDLIKIIAESLNLSDFVKIYENPVALDVEVRKGLIENAAMFNPTTQAKLFNGGSLHIVPINSILTKEEAPETSLENLEKPYPNLYSIISIDGTNRLVRQEDQFGIHAGFSGLDFWDKESGKMVGGVTVSGWADDDDLRFSSGALLNEQNRLFGILVAKERERLNETQLGIPVITCSTVVNLYIVANNIDVEKLGEYGCVSTNFDKDDKISSEFWNQIYLDVRERTKFPTLAYQLIDYKRLDEADILLLNRLANLNGFNEAAVASDFNNAFRIESYFEKGIEGYYLRKKEMTQLKESYRKLSEGLRLKGSARFRAELLDVNEDEKAIDTLITQLTKSESTTDTDQYLLMNVFLISQIDPRDVKTARGAFPIAFEALTSGGEKIIIVSTDPNIVKSGYMRIPVKKLDHTKYTNSVQPDADSSVTSIYMALSQREFKEYQAKQKTDQEVEDELNLLRRMYSYSDLKLTLLPKINSTLTTVRPSPSSEDYNKCVNGVNAYLIESSEKNGIAQVMSSARCAKNAKEWICFTKIAADVMKENGTPGHLSMVEQKDIRHNCGLP